ncbi:glycosyltransferase family 2 protein [Ancylothrix sp. C2]|uniref:glycosyltransferase family 2 protein n=1 Tax=Ancylothrix sp. D3o TaxID=2953691 RepID=UPI0021BB116F|nr:glycosyltransferase family 2 protein [Ancylothrix sp. D3o]MCT7950806.1 glycosyltransferase family 2 protein [Ancylothrix sp. D3o]
MKISFCAIVKNEGANLRRCLASVKPYVDELVVVDTGSTDDTVEIAREFGAKLGYFEWCDDFAAARNYALSLVTFDWVLVLDADEELVVFEDYFRESLIDCNLLGYTLQRREASQPDGMTPLHTLRLFRNLPELRFEQRFHEDLRYENKLLRADKIGFLESLRILHYGYETAEVRFQKSLNRNIPILERIRAEEGLSLMLLYCLAGMYADTQQPLKAMECYQEAFDRLFLNLLEGNPPEDFRFVPSLLVNLAVHFLQENNFEDPQFLLQRGLEWCPNFPPLNYLAGVTHRGLGLTEEAIAFFENCIKIGRENCYYTGEPFDGGYMTIYPAYDMACVFRELGQLEEARKAFELALSFDENFGPARDALEKLNQIIEENDTV